MLRTWTQNYDEINASPKDSRKHRRETTAKEPEIEQELPELSLPKRAVGRMINTKWI
jgi:hypothetical protein